MSRLGTRRIPQLLRRPSGVTVGGVSLPTTDLLVALYADQGIIDDGAGELVTWTDQDTQSGPHSPTQSSATDRPEIDATGGPEGGQTIAFGAQSTDTTGHLLWTSAVTAVASPHTYYIVCNPASVAGTQILVDFQTGRELCRIFGGNVQMFDGSTTYTYDAATTGWQCLTFQAATTASRAFRARSQLGTDQGWGGDMALGGGAALGANYVSTSPFNGRMSSVLIYGREHSAAERTQVWDLLASLYPSVGL